MQKKGEAEAAAVITNKELIDFLKDCEERHLKKVEYNYISNFFGDLSDEVIKFLNQNRIIEQSENITNLEVDSVIVISNDKKFLAEFEYVTQDMEKQVEYLSMEEYKRIKEKKTEHTICVIYMNPFSLEKYIDISNFFLNENIMVKMSFYYNHSIYISNIYKKEWYTPCPKCFFYSLESKLRAGNSYNTLNFQTIIDLLYENNPRFEIEGTVMTKDMLSVIMIMIKDLFYKGDANDILQRVVEYRLEDGSINEDVSYHWELCDCYE